MEPPNNCSSGGGICTLFQKGNAWFAVRWKQTLDNGNSSATQSLPGGGSIREEEAAFPRTPNSGFRDESLFQL